jgi:hypothetical protein
MIEKKPTSKKRSLQLNEKGRKLLAGISGGLNVNEAGRVAGYGTPQSTHLVLNLIRLNTPELLAQIGLPGEKLLRDSNDIRLRTARERAKMHVLYPKTNNHNGEDADSGEGTVVNINLGFLNPDRVEAVLAAARERVRGGNSGQLILDSMHTQNQGRTGPDKPV